MMYFTQYDGFEWTHKGYSLDTVQRRVNDNGVEVQEPAQFREITGTEYEVLRRFL